ncbi:MAG TPA: hypothetical protein VIG49_02050 [Acetobacteraceae bacterium]
MRRQTIGMIWVGGMVLAVLLYITGPDRFMAACLALIDHIDALFHDFLFLLGMQAFNVVRALAIANYIVFIVLAFLAAQRGIRSIWALIVVSTVYLLLVWRPEAVGETAIGRWFTALLIATVGAAVMTQRLMYSPGRRGGPPREPPGSSWPPRPPGRSI